MFACKIISVTVFKFKKNNMNLLQGKMDPMCHAEVHHSPGGLEVISAECFQFRRQHLTDKQAAEKEVCVDCLKERRNRGRVFMEKRSHGLPCSHPPHSTPKSLLHKSKSPIVFHLEQAIQKAPLRRFRKFRNSCEIDSASSTDTEDGKTAQMNMQRRKKIHSAKDIRTLAKTIHKNGRMSSGKSAGTHASDLGSIISSIQKCSSVSSSNVNKLSLLNTDFSKVSPEGYPPTSVTGTSTTDAEVSLQRNNVVLKKTYSEVAALSSSPVLNNKSVPVVTDMRKLAHLDNINVVCNDLHGTFSEKVISSNSHAAEEICLEKNERPVISISSGNSDCDSEESSSTSEDSDEGAVPLLKSINLNACSRDPPDPATSAANRNRQNSASALRSPMQHAQQFTHYFAQDSDSLHIELIKGPAPKLGPNDQAVDSRKSWLQRVRTVSESQFIAEEDSIIEEEPREYKVTQISSTKVQVSLARTQKRIRATSAPTLQSENCNSNKQLNKFKYVSIDLTNTGWTYTVEYNITPETPDHQHRYSQKPWQPSWQRDGDYTTPAFRFPPPQYVYESFQPIQGEKILAPSASMHELSFRHPVYDHASLTWQGLFPLMWIPHPLYPHLPVYLYPVLPMPPYPVGPHIPPYPPHNESSMPCPPEPHAALYHSSTPPERPWMILQQPDTSRPVAIFTVMCYNVLCDKYCTRQLYGYCPSWALLWDYRKKFIIEEIRNLSGDIIALQEVETEQFYHFFLPELKQAGYDGIFAPKSRAKTMRDDERKHVDGCAIFYRTNKFKLIKHQLVEFNQLAMSKAEGHHDMLNRVMTKDNIGLAALFETKEEVWENGKPSEVSQPLLVATCHVHWDPEYSDVKLIQTMMLMSELKNIVQEVNREHTSLRPGAKGPEATQPVPLLLCGDLNSLPDSGVVEYLTSGRVAANHIDFKELVYEDCLQKLSTTENKDLYTHDFKLSQAYNSEIMPFTNYTYDFKGVIDYIFFSREHMRSLGVLGPIDINWFQENRVIGCPNQNIPSDHFPLLVEIEMPAFSGSQSSGFLPTSSSSGNYGSHGPGTYLGNNMGGGVPSDMSSRHHGPNHRFGGGGSHGLPRFFRR